MPSDDTSPEPVAALVDLAEELRALTEQMLRIGALPNEVECAVVEARRTIQALTRDLEPHAPGDLDPRLGQEPSSQRPYFMSGVILGAHHPVRPDFELTNHAGVTRGRVNFGVTFEGPPGRVHGGFLSHFFDQVLGQHNLSEELPAMTGTLSTRFLRATPILTDLTFEIRHERIGERKVRTCGSLQAGDSVCCEGEGIFIVPREKLWDQTG